MHKSTTCQGFGSWPYIFGICPESTKNKCGQKSPQGHSLRTGSFARELGKREKKGQEGRGGGGGKGKMSLQG